MLLARRCHSVRMNKHPSEYPKTPIGELHHVGAMQAMKVACVPCPVKVNYRRSLCEYLSRLFDRNRPVQISQSFVLCLTQVIAVSILTLSILGCSQSTAPEPTSGDEVSRYLEEHPELKEPKEEVPPSTAADYK